MEDASVQSHNLEYFNLNTDGDRAIPDSDFMTVSLDAARHRLFESAYVLFRRRRDGPNEAHQDCPRQT